MKKLALLLIVALLLPTLSVLPTPSALSALSEAAPAWSDGLSAAQPYKGVPPVDLTKKLGYMVLDPLNNSNADGVVDALRIYLPRTDVEPGGGVLRVYEAGSGRALEEIPLSDAAQVAVNPIGAEMLGWLYWGGGICVEVRLRNALDIDRAYTVSLEQNAIVAPDYGIGNSAMEGRTGWSFTTKADSGVVERRFSGEMPPKVGDAVAIELKLPEGMAAAVFCHSEAVAAEESPDAEPGTLTARFNEAGPVDWGVALLGEGGELLSLYRYFDEVQP